MHTICQPDVLTGFIRIVRCICLLAAVGVAWLHVPAYADDTTPTRDQVYQHLDALASEDVAHQEDAREALRELGAAALKYLREAEDDAAHPARAQAASDYLDSLRGYSHRIVDAEGNPITDAKAVVRPRGGEPVVLQVNALGYLDYPEGGEERPRRVGAEFEVTHPDYGTMICNGYVGPRGMTLAMPVLRRESDLYGRAARGVIVDSQGNPVPGVRVTCRSLRAPGGGLIRGGGRGCSVVTNELGEFCFYPPRPDPQRMLRVGRPGLVLGQNGGGLTPPGSRYLLELTPPQDIGHWRTAEWVSNNDAATITLPRAVEVRLEVEGLLAEADRAAAKQGPIELYYRCASAGHDVELDPAVLFEPSQLLPGNYRLTYRNIYYRRVEVAEGGPVTLTFHLPPEITYTGTVIDGVTGEPIEGAIVFGWTGGGRDDNLALLTDEEWDALHAMPLGSLAGHESLACLRDGFTITQAARTNVEGEFALVRPIDGAFGRIMAVDQGRLPIYDQQLWELEPDEHDTVALDPLPLFPAAQVLVTPEFDHVGVGIRPSLYYTWRYTDAQQPAWFNALDQAVSFGRREFWRGDRLDLNAEQPLLIPAGVEFELVVRTSHLSGWGVIGPGETLRMEAGTQAVLPEAITFVRYRQIPVRVVDRLDRPVEGISVGSKSDASVAWRIRQHTNTQGIAYLYVTPGDTGQFAALVNPRVEIAYDEVIPPPEGDYEIRLSDEQIREARDLGP